MVGGPSIRAVIGLGAFRQGRKRLGGLRQGWKWLGVPPAGPVVVGGLAEWLKVVGWPSGRAGGDRGALRQGWKWLGGPPQGRKWSGGHPVGLKAFRKPSGRAGSGQKTLGQGSKVVGRNSNRAGSGEGAL